MAVESPLYRIRIECPVCKHENEFEAVKVGSYTESGRESDFRPTGRNWRHPDFQHTDPLYYSVATCSSCFYTRELDGNYKNWSRDKRFTLYRQKALREAHLAELAKPEGMLRLVGSHLDPAKHAHPTAINKLLLGIFDEQVTEGGDRLNVARYYLRIAWLFRDLGVFQSETVPAPRRGAELEEQIQLLRERLEPLHAQTRDLAGSLERFTGDQRITGQVEQLVQSYTGTLAEWQALCAMPTDAVPPAALPTATSPQARFMEYSSHVAFLSRAKTQWHGVPLSEHESLLLALHHYKDYFEHSRQFASPELEVQTAYLIAEIARRVGKPREASGYFNHAIRKGHELIHEYQQDPQRSGYLRKLVEMSIEQGKKNRDEQEVEAQS